MRPKPTFDALIQPRDLTRYAGVEQERHSGTTSLYKVSASGSTREERKRSASKTGTRQSSAKSLSICGTISKTQMSNLPTTAMKIDRSVFRMTAKNLEIISLRYCLSNRA